MNGRYGWAGKVTETSPTEEKSLSEAVKTGWNPAIRTSLNQIPGLNDMVAFHNTEKRVKCGY